MEENVHCPRCGNLLIKQIEPVHGSIQMLCVKCRTNLILTFDNGKLKVLGKARGSKNGNNLLNTEIARTGIETRLPAAAAYSGLEHTKLDHYIEDSRAIWEGKIHDLPVSQLGSAVGTHAGPGAVVVAYFMKQA